MTTFDVLKDLVTQRRSIRYFSDKSVDRATIDAIVDIARYSPSVENTQPWNFHVITNAEMKTKIMEFSCYGNFVAGASVFVVITCNRAAKGTSNAPIWNLKEMEYSCVAAIHAMMLAATAKDLGSCWVSLHHGPAHNLLKLKDHQVVIGGLMLGYLKPGENAPGTTHDIRPAAENTTYID